QIRQTRPAAMRARRYPSTIRELCWRPSESKRVHAARVPGASKGQGLLRNELRQELALRHGGRPVVEVRARRFTPAVFLSALARIEIRDEGRRPGTFVTARWHLAAINV